MPLEIRELKIKGYINKNKTSNQKDLELLMSKNLEKFKKNIVKQCVDEVLYRIERKARR